MWIARDKNGLLYIYKNKPVKVEEHWEPTSCEDVEYVECCWDGWLPEVKWEDDEPTEIILKGK